jgi:hypothetical protein
MAKDIEIVSISSQLTTVNSLPVAMSTTNLVSNVIGSSADTNQAVSMAGWLKRTQYHSVLSATTWLLSTAAVINTITVIPATTAATTFVLQDGSTTVISVPAAAHAIDAKPYTINLGGIRNTATAGFKVITGTSVAAIISGAFVATPTTA